MTACRPLRPMGFANRLIDWTFRGIFSITFRKVCNEKIRKIQRFPKDLVGMCRMDLHSPPKWISVFVWLPFKPAKGCPLKKTRKRVGKKRTPSVVVDILIGSPPLRKKHKANKGTACPGLKQAHIDFLDPATSCHSGDASWAA